MAKQEDALSFVFRNPVGQIEQLEEELSSETVSQFELVGFIKRGVDSSSSNTYRITEMARQAYITMYKKPDFINVLKGYFCHCILKF